jgi:hypothetical protein
MEDPSSDICLEDAIAQPSSNRFSSFKPIIIAAALGNKTLSHLKFSKEESPSFAYDFWTQHYKLDKTIQLHLAHFPFPRQVTQLGEYMLLLMTHLTLLGASILIHMRAFERANEAGFAENLALWSRERFEKLAMEISEACQEGGEFSRLKASSYCSCTV